MEKEAKTLSPALLFNSLLTRRRREEKNISEEPNNLWKHQRDAYICNTDAAFLIVKVPELFVIWYDFGNIKKIATFNRIGTNYSLSNILRVTY